MSTKRLVIDADVARAAGSEEATAPRAKDCRDFLQEVKLQNHRLVMTREISEEWKNHRSRFARGWLVSMYASRSVERVNPSPNNTLRNKITTTTSNQAAINAMEKDYHLLEAALATDKTIISLDETSRNLFKRAAQQVGDIRNIIWVNPEKTGEEGPITWLQQGAMPEQHRQLSA